MAGRRQTLRSSVLNSVCTHRRHLRLENLRTLVLADNCITRIQFSTDDDGVLSLHDSRDDLDDWVREFLESKCLIAFFERYLRII